MFEEFEEKRRVSDICSGEPLEIDAVCETCAHVVAAALKSEHDQVRFVVACAILPVPASRKRLPGSRKAGKASIALRRP